MLRLIVAIGVIAVLMPTDKHLTEKRAKIENAAQEQSTDVSTVDAYNAVNSLMHDVGDFCTRNEDACATGGAIISKAQTATKSAVEAIVSESQKQAKE